MFIKDVEVRSKLVKSLPVYFNDVVSILNRVMELSFYDHRADGGGKCTKCTSNV